MLYLISFIIPILILLPNLIFFRTSPRNIPNNLPAENKVMAIAENLGRIGVFLSPAFSTFHINNLAEIGALFGMAVLLSIYYVGWIRYFKNGLDYRLLFEPMFQIPVPMAVGPVLYFILTSVVLHSWYLLIAAIILGIGHIPISLNVYRALQDVTSNRDIR